MRPSFQNIWPDLKMRSRVCVFANETNQTMPSEIEEDAQRLYLYGNPETGEAVWSLLEAFVENNHAQVLAEIERVGG